MVGEVITTSFYNELSSEWCFDVFVEIVEKESIYHVTDNYITTVEYINGSELIIYNSCGKLVGYYETLQ